MSSSMRRRKGVMGRMIFIRRLLVCIEMTSSAWRCCYAIHRGVIVSWAEGDGETDVGVMVPQEEVFTGESASGLVREKLCEAWHYFSVSRGKPTHGAACVASRSRRRRRRQGRAPLVQSAGRTGPL